MRCANGGTLTQPDVLRSEGHAFVQVAVAAASGRGMSDAAFSGSLSPNILRYSTEKRPSSTKPRPVAISVTVADRPRADISARRRLIADIPGSLEAVLRQLSNGSDIRFVPNGRHMASD